jgi:hypothetical protein
MDTATQKLETTTIYNPDDLKRVSQKVIEVPKIRTTALKNV